MESRAVLLRGEMLIGGRAVRGAGEPIQGFDPARGKPLDPPFGTATAEVKCPRCRRVLSYVEPVKPESYGQIRQSTIAVPHESHIYD